MSKFNAIPIKIPTQFFTDMERAILNFMWKNKKLRIVKSTIKELLRGSSSLTSSCRTIVYCCTVMYSNNYLKMHAIATETEIVINGIKLMTQK